MKRSLWILAIVLLGFILAAGIAALFWFNEKSHSPTNEQKKIETVDENEKKNQTGNEADRYGKTNADLSEFYRLWSENKLDQASKLLEQKLRENPSDESLYLLASDFFLLDGTASKSISVLEEFLNLNKNGNHPNVLRALSDLYLQSQKEEDWQKGYEYAKKAWEQVKDNQKGQDAEIAATYAWALGKLGKYKESIDFYQKEVLKQIDLNKDPKTYFEYGIVLDMAGKENESGKVFQDLMNLKKENLSQEAQMELQYIQGTIEKVMDIKKNQN